MNDMREYKPPTLSFVYSFPKGITTLAELKEFVDRICEGNKDKKEAKIDSTFETITVSIAGPKP